MYQLIAVAMAKNINSDDVRKTVQLIKIDNYVLIQLIYNNFVKLYSTNFWNKKNALNNLSHSVAIMVTETMEENDE